MTKNIPKRNHWNWGISVKPKRTKSIMRVRFVSVIFKSSSLSKFTFLDCIFFLYNWTRTWALVLISSVSFWHTCVLWFGEIWFEFRSYKLICRKKNLKWFIMLHLHSNKIYMSHYFNLNYGMRMEKADKLLLTVKTSINCLTSMIFIPQSILFII